MTSSRRCSQSLLAALPRHDEIGIPNAALYNLTAGLAEFIGFWGSAKAPLLRRL